MAFLEVRQKFAAKKRQGRGRAATKNQGKPHQRTGTAADALEAANMPFPEPANVARFQARRRFGQNEIAKRRRDRKRHGERSQGGKNKRYSQRGEETTLDAAHH